MRATGQRVGDERAQARLPGRPARAAAGRAPAAAAVALVPGRQRRRRWFAARFSGAAGQQPGLGFGADFRQAAASRAAGGAERRGLFLAYFLGGESMDTAKVVGGARGARGVSV